MAFYPSSSSSSSSTTTSATMSNMSDPSSASSSTRPETPLATPTTNVAEPNSHLPSSHFLSQPRPEAAVGPPTGVVDTTTLAAHDFDVDARTGFMPPQPPLARLPVEWEEWEASLDDAVNQKLSLGGTPGLDEESKLASERWREGICKVSTPRSNLLKFYCVAPTSSSPGSCTST